MGPRMIYIPPIYGIGRAVGRDLQSREPGEAGFAEDDVIESRRSKLVPYGLLSSSSFHIVNDCRPKYSTKNNQADSRNQSCQLRDVDWSAEVAGGCDAVGGLLTKSKQVRCITRPR